MRMSITAELEVSLGSGGFWREVEIDFNYTPGDPGDRENPPYGDEVETLSFRIREPIGRPENGKWKMTPWVEPSKDIADLIEEAIDPDWLLGEARDLVQQERDAEEDYRYEAYRERVEAAE